jgi:peptidoglycan/LPS O-acetylase OafA/YrhL
LIGALAYCVYRDRADFKLLVLVTIAIGICLLINRWNGLARFASVTALVVVICSIPTLFRATKTNHWDKWVGELSYPLYICHFIPIWALASFQMPLFWRGGLIMLSSLLIAGALCRFVEIPVDAWRQRRLLPGNKAPSLQRSVA